jgi:hypothetical protein
VNVGSFFPSLTSHKSSFLAAIKLIKKDVGQVLRFRFFRNLILLSITLRFIFIFFFLPRTASDFGPDEGTYARLADFVSQGLAVQEFPEYGPYLYNQSKSLIGPSSLLIRFGIEAIDSVRIISALYGTLVPIIALLCYFTMNGNGIPFFVSKSRSGKVAARLLLVTLVFLPSNFLWASLGLRESASQFWLLTQFYFFIKLFQSRKEGAWVFAGLTVISTMFSFTARPQSALLMSSLMVLFGLFSLVRDRAISILLISVVSVIFGNLFSTTPSVKVSQKWNVYLVNETNPSLSEKSSKQVHPEIRSQCSADNQKILQRNKLYLCKLEKVIVKDSFLPPLKLLPGALNVATLEEKRNVNRVGASSALAPSECSANYDQIVPNLICTLSEIPYRLSAFLVRPFIIIDSGSSFLLFAGLENVIWLILISISLWISSQLVIRRTFSYLTTFIAAYLILFSVTASLYEGNLGTAFRHKSTTLGFLFLLVSLRASIKVL